MQGIKNKGTVDLLHGSIFRSMLLFAVPILISMLFQQLYNTVDVMLVGNLLGEKSLAAIGASAAIYDLLIGFSVGVGNGLSVVTARCFGTGDKKLLKRSVAAAVVIAACLAAATTIVAQIGDPVLLRMLNTPDEIIAEANAYISTITMFTIVTIAYNLCSGLLRAVGNSMAPMVFLVMASLLNIGLDVLLIRVAGMGIRGAAVATVISQGVSVLLSLVYIARKHQEIIPASKDFERDPAMYREMISQGLSMGMMSTIVNAGTMILQYGINSMGYLVIAGHTAARRVFSICNIPFIAIGHGMATFSSQNCGAGKYARIRRGVRDMAFVDLVLCIIVVIVMYINIPALARWLTGSEEAVVIDNCCRYVRFFTPFYVILGSLFTLRNTLQGLGEKRLPLISSIIELTGKVIFTVLLVPRFGYDAIIVCEPIIWSVMIIQLLYAFYTHPRIRDARTER